MTEIVNLRQARKRKLRADKDQRAVENRAKFGRTKDEKKRVIVETDLASRHLDRVKLDSED